MSKSPVALVNAAVSSIAVVLAVTAGRPSAAADKPRAGQRLTAFCIDFNWGPGGPNGFSPAGTFSRADPKEHYRWSAELGTNVIYTFCVSCDGYAWYRDSAVAPVQPGLKYDFLGDIAKLAHRDGKLAVGYFCAGANTYWGRKHPDQSYGTPSAIHIPYTREYLDYLAACIKDVLTKTEIDGFQVDWMYSPPLLMDEKQVRWMDCEKQMYAELFGRRFPGKEKLDARETLEFQRRALKRCWRTIHDAAKSTKPDCIIWLTCFDLRHPQLAGTGILREVDWLVNEHPDPASLEAVRRETGPHTRLWQCLCGWGDQNSPQRIASDPKYVDLCFMGFAAADPATTLPYTVNSSNPHYAANARNIEVLRKVFHQTAR
jgi:uncharacterized lipoprotein YddW (UPF0748 family)